MEAKARLQSEEREEQWNKKQKEHELEIHQLKEVRKKECERGAEMRKELEKKTSELQKLQNELRVLKEEGMRQEKEISQLKESTGLKNEMQEE